MRKTLDEAAVKRILDRAVQLDSERSGYMEPSQVHTIASELGISREAVDVAMAEHESAVEHRRADRRSLMRKLVIIGIAATAILGTLMVSRMVVPVERQRLPAPQLPQPARAPQPARPTPPEAPPVRVPTPPEAGSPVRVPPPPEAGRTVSPGTTTGQASRAPAAL